MKLSSDLEKASIALEKAREKVQNGIPLKGEKEGSAVSKLLRTLFTARVVINPDGDGEKPPVADNTFRE